MLKLSNLVNRPHGDSPYLMMRVRRCVSLWFVSKALLATNSFHLSLKYRKCYWHFPIQRYWPLNSKSGPGNSHICKHIRQAVTLTGLGTKTFGEGVDNIAKAYMRFVTHFPEGRLKHWQPTTFYPHVAIDAHSRYFTERRLAPQEPNITFGPLVDPKGLLASIQGSEFIHGQDNYVEYLELKQKDGNLR